MSHPVYADDFDAYYSHAVEDYCGKMMFVNIDGKDKPIYINVQPLNVDPEKCFLRYIGETHDF